MEKIRFYLVFSVFINIFKKGYVEMKNIREGIISFFSTVSASNEKIYLILLTLYILIYYELKVAWKDNVVLAAEMVRYALLGIVMWGAAVYLFYVIAQWRNIWKNNFQLILLAVILIAATGFFSAKMSTNLYGVVMDAFFCMMACGKSFRKMLKCMLAVSVSMLTIAGIGIPCGFTWDLGKPQTNTPGHSLGIEYPNSWGYLVFLTLMLIWYLYLRNKPFLTFAVFWLCAAFNWFYILCRTVSGLSLLFPFFAMLVDFIERHLDRKAAIEEFKRKRFLEWIVIAIPFISFAVMMYLSMIVEWMHQFYHGPLRNLAWRFMMGGLYFRTYGIPLIGNPYSSNEHTYINVNGEFIEVGILDSSFAAYLIMRGIIWLIFTLFWLCIAHWKAIKKRDYAIPFLEVIILGFAMMERPGLEMWYNFILLYPLAKIMSKAGTEKVLEFANKDEINTFKIDEMAEN